MSDTSIEPIVAIFADADDIGVARLVPRLAAEFTATWWRFGLPESLVSVYADSGGFELNQPEVNLDSSELRRARLVVYRRRLLQPRPLVSSTLQAPADHEFSEREWTSLVDGLLLAEEARTRSTWINSPTATLLGSNKLSLLLQAVRNGLPVPSFSVSTPVRFPSTASGELVTKAISANERIDEKRHFSTARISATDMHALPGAELPTPAFLQEYIAPSLEIRVFFALGRLLALALTPSDRHIDIRYASLADMSPREHDLPGDIGDALVSFARSRSLSYCTFDLVISKRGQYAVVDITPNGDWGYFESDDRPFLSEFLADAIIRHVASHR